METEGITEEMLCQQWPAVEAVAAALMELTSWVVLGWRSGYAMPTKDVRFLKQTGGGR